MSSASFEQFYRRYYRERILELARGYPEEGRSLTIQWDDLYQFDPDLADDLRTEPSRVLGDATAALRSFDVPVAVDLDRAEVCVEGYPRETKIRDLRAEHVNQFVSVRGIVRKATPVRPKVELAIYECLTCGGEMEIVQRGQELREPQRCHHCERNTQLERIDDRSKFVDAQRLRIQESPEGLRGGETPQNLDIHLEDDLTGIVSPGDRVTASGVLRLREQESGGKTSPILDVYMEGNFIDIEEEEFEVMQIEEADEEEIRELADDPDIFEKVVDSIAPSIWGYEDEKLALALQLFSGVRKPLPDGSRVRGDIHVLLVGDPGTGKCVSGDTIVTLGDRSETAIKDLVESNLDDPTPVDDGVYDKIDIEVPSMSSNGRLTNRRAVKVWKREAPRQLYRIRTTGGREVDVTPSHPLYVRGIVPIQARHLTVGDTIAVTHEQSEATRISTDGGAVAANPQDTNRGIYWEEIESIERYEPEDDWVYDLEVSGTHNYVTNGVISHNSQLLQYITKIAPRSVYTSGKGSSAAGLTAAAIRDDFGDGQQWTLEAGALVLADQGIAAVDELDKMRCVTGDTEVHLADGEQMAIAEMEQIAEGAGETERLANGRTIRNTEFEVRSMDQNGGIVVRPVTAIHRYDPPSELVEVRLTNGESLRSTRDHPYFIEGTSGVVERPAEAIKPDDQVIVPAYHQPYQTDGGVIGKPDMVDPLGDTITCAVESVRTVPNENQQSVYDLTVEGTKNFVANGMVVHNSEDRSAMHEALEQQSYHPAFEMLLSDGRRMPIGELVEQKMDEYPEKIVDGVDCDILPIDDLGIHSVDFEEESVEKLPVDRVSRHDAPDEFVQVTYSNGRSILVTPEHPTFVDRGDGLETVPAESVQEGWFAPAPRKLPNSASSIELPKEPHTGKERRVDFPSELTEDLSEVLGFLTAEGHSYVGSVHEIGFSNQDERLLAKYKRFMESTFGFGPSRTVNGEGTVTLRWISTHLYRWFTRNFPEVMETAREKRIPARILGASEEHIRRFLVGAFAGDGGVESTAIAYSTASEGLAQDYADALSKIGVASRIHHDTAEDSWKVYIMGDSNGSFVDQIIEEDDERYAKARSFVERGEKTPRHHDVLPTSAIREIRSIRRLLGLALTGEFDAHLKQGFGIHVNHVREELDELNERIAAIRDDLKFASDTREIRNAIGWSARQLSERIVFNQHTISYAENGGYSESKRRSIESRSRNAVATVLVEAEQRIADLENKCDLRYYRIKSVEVIPNEGEYQTDWVYDVTVEPTNTFVSKGVVLHNSVSVSKAGINATLQARCALLGAANPKYGRFDQYEPIPEQIELEPALISRFDLIFTVDDLPDAERDEHIAEHILKTNYAGELNNRAATNPAEGELIGELEEAQQDVTPAIEPEVLRMYVAYATQRCIPTMTMEAREAIKEFYMDLRSQGIEEDSPVPMTARKLEALVRLAEASARIRLSDEVTTEDTERVIELVRTSMGDIGYDPESGEYDVDMIETGTPKTQRDRIRSLKQLMEHLEEEYDEGVPLETIIEEAEDRGLDADRVEHELSKMKQSGEIYEPSQDRYRLA